MRPFALAMLACTCACAPAIAQAPVEHAHAVAPHPGPCATEHDGPEGSVRIDYEYDARHRLIREVESKGVQRLWSYDAAGRRAREIIIDGERLHAIWYAYDERGQLVAIEEDATGERDIVVTRAREYDARGRLVRLATTRRGELVEELALHYDARGKLAWEDVARPSGAERIDIEIDAAGRIVARRSAAEAQHFVYADGRLTWMIVDRDGHAHRLQHYAYDHAGNLVRADTHDGAGRRLRTTTHSYACWSS